MGLALTGHGEGVLVLGGVGVAMSGRAPRGARERDDGEKEEGGTEESHRREHTIEVSQRSLPGSRSERGLRFPVVLGTPERGVLAWTRGVDATAGWHVACIARARNG